MNLQSRINILHAALFTPANRSGRMGLTILFEGDPGTSKSDVVEDFVRETLSPMHVEVLSPSERGEAAFGVTPYPRELSNGQVRMTYPTPYWLEYFEPAVGGVVFVDEANTVNPVLQAPIMGLIGARRIGGELLPDNVRVIGACNPVDIATNGHDFEPALANRWCFLKWAPPSIQERRAYNARVVREEALRAPVDPIAEEARVRKAWPKAYAKAVAQENMFFAANPQWKNQMPSREDPRIHRAWPSDRSWSNATRALAGAEVHGLTDSERDELIAGFIGEAACEQYFTWLDKADLPAAEDILDERVNFSFDHRMDRNAAILTACSTLVTTPECQNRKERSVRLWELMHNFVQSAGNSMEVVVPTAVELAQAKLIPTEADKLLTKLHPILVAAGIGAR